MMKLFVICVFVAVALAQGTPESKKLTFDFLGTDGVSAPELLPLPMNFDGSIDIRVTDNRNTDVWLCLHWVVPVVAPYGEGVELDSIWSKTCTRFETIPEGNSVWTSNGITVRSGNFYVTAAIDADIDSDGVIDNEYNFEATFSYGKCNDGFFGSLCSLSYQELSYDGPNLIPSLGDTPQYFVLPTNNTVYTGLFASSLDFTFQVNSQGRSSRQEIDFTMKERLNGAPGNDGDDRNCRDATKCSIFNPPFIFTPDYYWGIFVTASQDVSNVSLTATFTECKDNIGADCIDYEDITDTEVGHVEKYSKNTTFVFGNKVSVAIGGLDGYTQQDTAPNVYVQIDSQPYAETKYFGDNVLVSAFAEANVVDIDMSENPNTRIVLTVTPDKSFGIWRVDENTKCPWQCDRHGDCSTQEYVCLCNEGYEDLDCMHEIKDFTIEYIILIAVGCLLILSIVIGVPIYCFLNRNQEYETVA